MSHFSPASTQQLWASPIRTQSQAAQQSQQQQRQQQANEEAWARQQQQQQQRQYFEHPNDFHEPVDRDIYTKATAVSSPRLAGSSANVDPNATMSQTVLRRVEVPFTRSVQVPTQVVRLEPTLVEQRVPVKRFVEVPGFQAVNESYIDYEEREAIREREVWVKKVVPERYVERIPVQRVRTVQRPTTVIREETAWETVAVPTTKRVVVPGYKVEQVADSKVVEVEEEQQFALRPEPMGPPEIRSTRDLGRLPNALSHLPDAHPGARPEGVPVSQGGMYPYRSPPGQAAAPVFGGMNGYTNRPASASPQASRAPANPLEFLRAHGMSVDETHSFHTDGTGVVVTRVERGSDAARAGLQLNDIITAVQGRPVQTVAEFVALLQRAPGAVTLHVNRDGRRNISLVFSPQSSAQQ